MGSKRHRIEPFRTRPIDYFVQRGWPFASALHVNATPAAFFDFVPTSFFLQKFPTTTGLLVVAPTAAAFVAGVAAFVAGAAAVVAGAAAFVVAGATVVAVFANAGVTPAKPSVTATAAALQIL